MRNIPAAAKLEGTEVGTGWHVKKAISPGIDATGGTFSYSYVVQKNGRDGFMKAFDFSDAFRSPDVLAEIQNLTTSYNYEKNILLYCKEKRMSRVVVAVEHGDTQVLGYDQMSGKVFFLIFELADGDVRKQVSTTHRLDSLWSMRVLKDVVLGLDQVHRRMIAHQDVKPSNILIFGSNSKISDFGRASRRGYPAVHDELEVAGDMTYAPPEQLYGYLHPEFTTRRFGCDMYMLGTLASFMFTGINITAYLFENLDSQFHHLNWGGTYQDVIPYLEKSYFEVIEEISVEIDSVAVPEGANWIAQLCHPDLARRGHPRSVGRLDQYSLQRYVATFERAARLAEIYSRSHRRLA